MSVAGTRAYTLAYRGDDEFVVALDRGTGKELWAASLGAARESHVMAFLRQRQPVLDADRVYALSTAGHLACLDADQGKELWRRRYADDFGGRPSPFGWTDYPLIDGDQLVCTPGGKDAFHVALDKQTGEVRWKSAQPPRPFPVPLADGCCQTRRGAALRPEPGRRAGRRSRPGRTSSLWRYEKVSSSTANMATPVVRGDRVFADLRVRHRLSPPAADPDRRFQVSGGEGSTSTRTSRACMAGSLPWATTSTRGQSATYHTAKPTCYDWKDGKVSWQQEGPGKGGVATVAADGQLYLRFADGLVVLAEATPGAFKETGQLDPVTSGPNIRRGRSR